MAQNSKFQIETWNLAKTKVVEEEEIYNFDIEKKLDLSLELGRKMGLKLAKGEVYYACLLNANDNVKPMISKLSTKLTSGCYTYGPRLCPGQSGP